MDRRRRAELLAGRISSSRKVTILTHKNPDGDAVGSAVALGEALAALGIEVVSVNLDEVPKALQWLPGAELIARAPAPGFDPDLLILLDCNSIDRTGFTLEEAGPHGALAVIDHHLMEGPDREEWLVDSRVPASGSLVWELIAALGVEPTRSIAEALYVALHTDTGGFRFGNTDADAFELAAKLVRAGARPDFVAGMLLEREPEARFKLLGLALGTLETALGGRVALARVTLGMFRETGTSDEQTDGFVNYPRSIAGVEVALLFKEKSPGVWRVALRSKGTIDVASVARLFGGGGHRNASGATLCGTFDDARSRVTDALADTLAAHSPGI